ncbi:MAG: T9SS type A sorting domain-containing protein, partial [Bacteroidota bacterium]
EWQGQIARINWVADAELNLRHYELEQSADKQRFERIATVQANGTQNGPAEYVFNAPAPDWLQATQVYYRLKTVDLDGTKEYSQIIRLNLTQAYPDFQLYPNPAREQIALRYQLPTQQQLQVEVFDQQGRKVHAHTIEGGSGMQEYLLRTQTWAQGLYLLRLSDTNQAVWERKFVKQ